MNEQEIMQALENDLKVFWINSAYKVFLDSGKLYAIYKDNSYMTPLAEDEYKDCFIEGI